MDSLRIDKWLWAARFCKTRTLATEEILKGRVQVNGQVVKPSRELRRGDTVTLRIAHETRVVQVLALDDRRGPAPVAQQLYAETADSLREREAAAQQRRLAREPALSITQGRPTKRDRRDLEQARHGWDARWSASLNDDRRNR